MTRLLLAAALAFAPAPAFAQTAPPAAPAQAAPAGPAAPAPLPDADPALWVVRDSDTTIYLFGTFHLLDGRPWFNDEVKAAFDASGELVMEAILPEDQASLAPMIRRYAVDPGGRTLSSRLDAEQNAALTRVLAPLGVPATAFDRFEPWFMAMTLPAIAAQRLGLNARNGPETILTLAARARSMPIGELEGLEWQVRLFDTMPEALQLANLGETLAQIDQLPARLTPMLDAWSTGDVERLAALLAEDEEDTEADRTLHRLLLTDRNAAWARWIGERMARPGTVFVAVGAAHLGGPDSVQAVLAAHGLRAERVPHVAAR